MGPILFLLLLPSPRCWVCNRRLNNDIFHLTCYMPFQECVRFSGDRVAQTCLAQAVNLLWAAFTDKVTHRVRGNDLAKPLQPVSHKPMDAQIPRWVLFPQLWVWVMSSRQLLLHHGSALTLQGGASWSH